MILALVLACGHPAEPEPTDGATSTTTVQPDPFLGGDCSSHPASTTTTVHVLAVDHVEWWNRLTESPPIQVDLDGSADGSLQIAFGTGPDVQDEWCWTDVDDPADVLLRSLWLDDGETVYAQARWRYADGSVSEAVASDGWTVDIVPPDAVASVEAHGAVSEHRFAWSGGDGDAASGFDHWEAALGSLPGGSDLTGWVPVDVPELAFDLGVVPDGQWAYPAVRSVDVAGNASLEVSGEGFVRCPTGYVFVPPNGDPGIETDGFCVAKYEAKIAGNDDGAQGWSDAFVEESRASGTPWTDVERAYASMACAAHGMQYTLISNKRWQAVARDIEGTGDNWSGGTVGVGFVNHGHADGDPHVPLPASTDDDPCSGTNDPSCDDPAVGDWSAKRTHVLSDGEILWDFAGNVAEHVDGALAADAAGLWTSFDEPQFTSDAGWEDRRASFGPLGAFATDQGMGRFYLGSAELLRGGSFASDDSPGTAGSDGEWDAGIYGGHHSVWWGADETQGFRCVYSP